MFLFVILLKNYLQKGIHQLQNIDLRLKVMSKLQIILLNFSYQYKILLLGSNVFCHLDTTQYHKNKIPQKLEDVILSSCTHVLFSSADTNFDSIANNWYFSQSNGIKNK